MAKWKPYNVKKEKRMPPARPPVYTKPGKPEENLTGLVNGMEASDIEERSARALGKYKVEMAFRTQFLATSPPYVIYGGAGRNQLGSVEADFFGQVNGMLLAVQVDGEFAHKTAQQREHDRLQDTKLFKVLRELGGGQVVRIPHYYLEDQEQADQTWRLVIGGKTEFA